MKIKKYILPGIVILPLLGILGSCLKGGTMDSISISPENRTIATGTTQQFAAIAHFTDGTTVNWTSAADWTLKGNTAMAIATISETLGLAGLFTGASGTGILSTGTFTVTARDTVNDLSSRTTITVAYPDEIIVSAPTPTPAPGAQVQLTARAKFSGVTRTQDLTSSPTISWETLNIEIATVSKSGLFTAGTTSTGPVDIKATYAVTDIITEVTTTVIGTTTLTVE
jgi:hypothetical protein